MIPVSLRLQKVFAMTDEGELISNAARPAVVIVLSRIIKAGDSLTVTPAPWQSETTDRVNDTGSSYRSMPGPTTRTPSSRHPAIDT